MTDLKVAIVTGGARGIGAATAGELARAGYSVAILDREPPSSAVTLPYFECDVSQRASVEAAIALVEERLGTISIVVNNAGVGGPFHLTSEVSDEEWDWIHATNLKSVFFFCRNLLPKMKERGFGRVINIASIQGLYGAARSSTYVASKHAVVGYTRAIAAEWGAYGITCNAICPGVVDTKMGIQEERVSDHLSKVLKRTPVGRIAKPDEIATWVRHLASENSGYVNGAIFTLDGGMTCQA